MTKERSRRRVCSEEAELVRSVHAFFKQEKDIGHSILSSRVAERTAKATGLGRSTVEAIVGGKREYVSSSIPETRERDSPIEEDYRTYLRTVYYEIRRSGQRPTVRILHAIISERISNKSLNLKDWSVTSLWRLMHRVGFIRKKISPDSSLKENSKIIAQRHRYLKLLDEYRAEGRTFWWQDETWVTAHLTDTHEWLDAGEGSTDKPTKGLAGKGARTIICGIGSDTQGWLEDSLLVYRGAQSPKSSDYHTDMNWNVFSDWMERRVLPKIPPHSVIVIDRASYHLVLTEESKPASSTLRKQQLVAWLEQHNIPLCDTDLLPARAGGLTRDELYQLCKTHRPSPIYLIAQKIAALDDVKLLILPIHHPELNPIENMWAFIKGYVKRNNITFRQTEVERLVEDAYTDITPKIWTGVMNKQVHKAEEAYKQIRDELEESVEAEELSDCEVEVTDV